MEKLKNKIRNLTLRSSFMLSVLITFCIVVILSGLIIWGCTAFRHYLLPDSDAVYLTVEQIFEDGTTNKLTHLLEFGDDLMAAPRIVTSDGFSGVMLDEKYAIQKIEKGIDTLTPKRRIAYQFCGVAMVAVPVMFSIAGILICGFFFYRRKLSRPLKILSDATEQIAAQNLDFSLEYYCEDELGQLCRSFEQMRRALVENNKAMWELLEQRRLMQASIAHDLRNPIAIIEGYTEYLQMNLPGGKMSGEKLERIVGNLNLAAKRLEHYTESVRTLNQLEDMAIHREETLSSELIKDIGEDLGVIASGKGIMLSITNDLPECRLQVDHDVIYRILENTAGNAMRFAQSSVSIHFQMMHHRLLVTVTDDGPGFSDEVLKKKEKLFLPAGQEDGHLGMGLAISRLLCEKHGGNLKFHNRDSTGAVVEISLAVR